MATINFFCASGGGSLGAFQVGVLVALSDKGVLLDGLAGTSTGGIQAGFMSQAAAGDIQSQRQVANNLKSIWLGLRGDNDIYRKPAAGIFGIGYDILVHSSVYSTEPLKQLLQQHVTQDPRLPIGLGSVHLNSGKFELLRPTTAAELRNAILAGSSIPALFPPQGDIVDGGVRHNAPLKNGFDMARSLVRPGDTLTMHLALASPSDPAPEKKNWQNEKVIAVAMRSLTLLQAENCTADVQGAEDTNDLVRWFDSQGVPDSQRPPSLQGKVSANVITYVPSVWLPDSLSFNPADIAGLISHGYEAVTQA